MGITARPYPFAFVFLCLLCAAAAAIFEPEDGRVDEGDGFAPLYVPDNSADAIQDEYIVSFHAATSEAEILQFIRETIDRHRDEMEPSFTADVHRTFSLGKRSMSVNLSPEALKWVRGHRVVESLEQDMVIKALPTDQSSPWWGVDRLDQANLPVDSRFQSQQTGAGVKIYVVDTGVLSTHEDFDGRVSQGFTAFSDGRSSEDCNGHGTHVASTAAGSRWGVAKGASVVAVRVLDCQGSGTSTGVIGGIQWAKNQIDAEPNVPAIVTMSLGGGRSSSLNAAVKAIHDAGAPVSVAAGNENADACGVSPASEPTAITVGSTTSSDARSSFSNWGSCVDLFAPGSQIRAAWWTSISAVRDISGTSMATPHVAGVLALIREHSPSLSPTQVAAKLLCATAPDKLRDIDSSSPNRLLQVSPNWGSSECGSNQCPNNCSSHGSCLAGSCTCDCGYYGRSCADALPVTDIDPCRVVDLRGSTSGQQNLIGQSSPERIYRFNITVATTFAASLCSPATNYDTYLSLMRACEGNIVASNDDGERSCTGHRARYTPSRIPPVSIQPGMYYLIVEGYGQSVGDYGLTIEIGNNNACPSSDHRGVLAFQQAQASVVENEGFIVVAVQRLQSTSGAVSVSYNTSDDTAVGSTTGDFIPVSGMLSFAAGNSVKNIRIPIRDNSVSDGTRQFIVHIHSPVGGAVLGTLASMVVTITDDEAQATPAPSPTVPGSPPSTSPPNSCACGTYGQSCSSRFDVVTVDPCATVNRMGSTVGKPNLSPYHRGGDVVYKFTISNNAQMSFSLCSSHTRFDTHLWLYRGCPLTTGAALIHANDDSRVRCRSARTFFNPSRIPTSANSHVALAAGTYYLMVGGYGFSEGSFGLTIEAHGNGVCGSSPTTTVSFGVSSIDVQESAGSFGFDIVRTGDMQREFTVRVTAVAGTATQGDDFPPYSSTYSFSQGTAVRHAFASVTNDVLHEGNETFTLQLSVESGEATLGTSTLTVVIMDNDPVPVIATTVPAPPATTPSPGSGVCTPNTCNGHGLCAAGACTCHCGWEGSTCNVPSFIVEEINACSPPSVTWSTRGRPRLFGSNALVFKFNVNSATTFSATTCAAATNFDTVMRLFRGCPRSQPGVPRGQLLSTNDDGPVCRAPHSSPYSPSKLYPAVSLSPGNEYFLVVNGYNRFNAGQFGLVTTLSNTHACAVLNSTGTISLSGDVVVNAGQPAVIGIARNAGLKGKISFMVGTVDGTAVRGLRYNSSNITVEMDENQASASVHINTLPWTVSVPTSSQWFKVVLSNPSFGLLIDPSGASVNVTVDPQLDACASGCSGHGSCVSGACQCSCGWTGLQCETSQFSVTDLDLCSTQNVQYSTSGLPAFRNRGPEKVFRFNISQPNTRITVDLCSQHTNFDTFLRIFSACPSGNTRSIAYNDDGPRCRIDSARFNPSRIPRSGSSGLSLSPGIYYMSVTGYRSSQSGSFGLTLTQNHHCSAVPSQTSAPAPTGPIATTPAPTTAPVQVCSAACHLHGVCVLGICRCDCGYSGSDCDVMQTTVPVSSEVSLPYTASGNIGSNTDFTGGPGRDKVWMVNMTTNAKLHANWCNGRLDFPAALSVWVGCPGTTHAILHATSIQQLPSSSCSVTGNHRVAVPSLDSCLSANRYHVLLESASSAIGQYSLQLSETSCAATDAPPSTSPPSGFCQCGTYGSSCSSQADVVNPCSNPAGVSATLQSSWQSYTINRNGFGSAFLLKINVTNPGRVEVSLCDARTNFDTYVAVYSSCGQSAFSGRVAYNDDGRRCSASSANYAPSFVSFNAQAGMYFVVVTGFRGAVGRFAVHARQVSGCFTAPAAPPSTAPPTTQAATVPPTTPVLEQNPSACSSYGYTVTPFNPCSAGVVQGSTTGGSRRVGNSSPEKVYQFTVSVTTSVTISLCHHSTNFDTVLRLYNTCPRSGSGGIGYNDDGPRCVASPARFNPSRLTRTLSPGVYYIVVEGYSSSQAGSFGMSVSFSNSNACGSGNPSAPVIIGFYRSHQNVSENAGHARIEVDRTGPLINAVAFTIDWAGSQFVGSFGAWEARAYVDIPITNDNVWTSPGYNVSSLTVSSGGAQIGQGVMTVGIVDDEFEPCPNNCGGHGTCSAGVCQCDCGFFGRDCSSTSFDAIDLNICNKDVLGSTVGKANIYGTSSGNVVYKFNLTSPATLTLDMCHPETNYDSFLYVLDECPVLRRSAQYRNDDGPTSSCGGSAPYPPSRLSNMNLGVGTWYIVVGGYRSHEGSFRLRITFSGESACTSGSGSVSFGLPAGDGQFGALSSSTDFAATALSVQGEDGKDSAINLLAQNPKSSNWRAVVQSLPTGGLLFQTSDGETRTKLFDSAPAAVESSTRTVIFVPNAGNIGNNAGSFTYIVQDGDDVSAAATVSINVAQATRLRGANDINDLAGPEDTDQIISLASVHEGVTCTPVISQLPTAGKLFQYNNGARGAMFTAINTVVTDAPNYRVIFSPITNTFGSPYSKFFYRCEEEDSIGLSTHSGVKSDYARLVDDPIFSQDVGLLADTVPSGWASVTMNVNATNDAPVGNSQRKSGNAGSSVTITLTGSDPDGDAITPVIHALPSKGNLYSTSGGVRDKLLATGDETSHVVIWQPTNNGGGVSFDAFQFKMKDTSNVMSSVATVTLDLNIAPNSTDATASTNEDTDVTIALSGNDAEFAEYTAQITSLPSRGALFQYDSSSSVGASIGSVPTALTDTQRRVVYRPSPDEFGVGYTTFQFKAVDLGGLASVDPGTVTINVQPVNDAPTVPARSLTIEGSGDALIELVANDIDNSTITRSVSSLPASGSVYHATSAGTRGSQISSVPTQVPTGSIVFVPANANAHSITIGVTATDDLLTSAQGLITVTVQASSAPPPAQKSYVRFSVGFPNAALSDFTLSRRNTIKQTFADSAGVSIDSVYLTLSTAAVSAVNEYSLSESPAPRSSTVTASVRVAVSQASASSAASSLSSTVNNGGLSSALASTGLTTSPVLSSAVTSSFAGPTVTGFEPSNTASGVSSSADLKIFLSSAGQAGSGQLHISTSDNRPVVSLAVSSFTSNGAIAVFSLGSTSLPGGETVKVTVDAAAIVDSNGNFFAGVNDGAWSFSVVAPSSESRTETKSVNIGLIVGLWAAGLVLFVGGVIGLKKYRARRNAARTSKKPAAAAAATAPTGQVAVYNAAAAIQGPSAGVAGSSAVPQFTSVAPFPSYPTLQGAGQTAQSQQAVVPQGVAGQAGAAQNHAHVHNGSAMPLQAHQGVAQAAPPQPAGVPQGVAGQAGVTPHDAVYVGNASRPLHHPRQLEVLQQPTPSRSQNSLPALQNVTRPVQSSSGGDAPPPYSSKQ